MADSGSQKMKRFLRASIRHTWLLSAIVAVVLLSGACRSENAAETVQPVAKARTPVTQTSDTAPEAAVLSTLLAATPPPPATPTPEPATATPTPTPTPTAVPTATPKPGELLALGHRFYRYGDYANARAALQQLLAAENGDAHTRLEAIYVLAQTFGADQAPSEALAALGQLETEAAAAGIDLGDFGGKIHYLRGQLQEELRDYAGAIAAYWRFLEIYPWMADTVQVHIAEDYIALGDIDGAAAAYRRAADANLDRVGRVRILEMMGKALSGAGRYGEAVAVYDEILGAAENLAYRADIQYLAGQALSSAGDGAGAIERWRAATTEAPASRSAYLALIELVNRGVEFDLYQRGYIDLESEAYAPAIGAYQAYLAATDATDSRFAQALFELGLAFVGAEDYGSAIDALDRVITEFPQCTCFGDAWLAKARAQIAAGDSAGARRTYRTFARDHAGNALAPDALWWSGVRALRDDNEVEAVVDFLALAERFPNSKRAPDALYAVGVGALQKGFYGQAAETFGRLQRVFPEYRWPAVSYWLGRAYQARGDGDLAQAQWRVLADKAPDIYYGILATMALRQLPISDGAMLQNIALIAGPPSRLENDDGSQEFAEAWLRAWPAMGNDENLGALPATIAADPDISRARLLFDLGQRADGLLITERIFQRYKDDPVTLYPLSLEFERLGAYRHSISAMVRLLEFSPAGLVENAPVFLQRRAYPRAFADLIEREALARNISPLLYFSVIRQESLFEEGAQSWAAAQGLAQIIPDTARWVAERLGHPDWSNELIYRPYINVAFGAYYLDWARTYLDGNMVSALVGYNAGPGNSQYWRELAGSDDTLFVEVLAVNEPRIYVQTIMSNLYHYTRLYGR